MQYEEQQGMLVRKRRILTSFLVRGLNDDDFVTNYAIVNELRRLGEQIDLQHLARMKVLSSTFNLYSISDSSVCRGTALRERMSDFLLT
jgi:hypothetical protein